MTGAVLVALDGSQHAPGVLPIARRLAELAKASVRLLEVRAGPPAEDILAAAADCGATIIVMCAHTADVQPVGVVGDTALAVIRGGPCPVVLVDPARAPGDWPLRRVLAAHDGSPSVSGGLGPAAELAREAGAELVVLQVACDTCSEETGSIAPPAYLDQLHHEWPAWSAEFQHRLGCHCVLANLHVRLVLAHGDPAGETIRVAGAEAVDLIVLAWRGHWDGLRASTLKAVLRDAPCPVMVTRISAA